MLKIQERHDIKKTTNTHPILQEKKKTHSNSLDWLGP